MYDFYIVPVANPDGYVYSWKSDRMWRKNRRPVNAGQEQQQQLQQPIWGGWGGPAAGSSTKVLNLFQFMYIYGDVIMILFSAG